MIFTPYTLAIDAAIIATVTISVMWTAAWGIHVLAIATATINFAVAMGAMICMDATTDA